MKQYIHTTIFSLSFLCTVAQEGLRPLGSNLQYAYGVNEPQPPTTALQKKAGSIQLPFKEDFQYSTKQHYPSQEFWTDSTVYISSGLGIAPPSIGVAAFDGLNKHGYPYLPSLANMNASGPADTLTSQPINLYTVGSVTLLPTSQVALSFYYQPRGYGDPPEASDSLILDFYNPTKQRWQNKIWFKKGNSPQDTIFRRVFIKMDSADYLQDNFRIRFRNSATTAGNFDQWLIDYIYLDYNRVDTLPGKDDITFSHVPSPLLKDYSAMPFNQYSTFEMAPKNSVRIRNNNPATQNAVTMSYDHYVYDSANTQVQHYSGGADNLPAFVTSGYSKYAIHANPVIPYSFPTMTDSTDYTVRHILSRAPGSTAVDFFPRNDTVFQDVQFRNYYAFDDGSGEAGYYVNGVNGMIAVKIRLNVPDTLRALRIYFDPVGNMNNAKNWQFRICVWDDGSIGPGSTFVVKDSVLMKQTYLEKGFKGVPEFKLTKPALLGAGVHYIGIQQLDKSLTIGYDRNYDFHKSLYYNSGNGWNQSQITGALMLRPVFGPVIPPPLGIAENRQGAQRRFLAFPNPTAGELYISLDQVNNTSCELHNVLGQRVLHERINAVDHTLYTGGITSGIYYLVLLENGQLVSTQKIIIEH